MGGQQGPPTAHLVLGSLPAHVEDQLRLLPQLQLGLPGRHLRPVGRVMRALLLEDQGERMSRRAYLRTSRITPPLPDPDICLVGGGHTTIISSYAFKD